MIEIADQTYLSRPAGSHHMQILKDAGVVKSLKQGTQIYYYFDPDDNEMQKFQKLANDVVRIMGMLPERGEEAN